MLLALESSSVNTDAECIVIIPYLILELTASEVNVKWQNTYEIAMHLVRQLFDLSKYCLLHLAEALDAEKGFSQHQHQKV